MEKKKLVLTGTAGYSEGETFSIAEGDSAVLGRSRSCDFSLRKLKAWMEADKDEQDTAEEFKTVSRRHAKVEVRADETGITVAVTDLSRNGTFVDEEKIGPRFEIKEWDTPHYLRLGEHEQYKLEIMDLEAGEEEKEGDKDDVYEDDDAPEEETDRRVKQDDNEEDESAEDDSDNDDDKDEEENDEENDDEEDGDEDENDRDDDD